MKVDETFFSVFLKVGNFFQWYTMKQFKNCNSPRRLKLSAICWVILLKTMLTSPVIKSLNFIECGRVIAMFSSTRHSSDRIYFSKLKFVTFLFNGKACSFYFLNLISLIFFPLTSFWCLTNSSWKYYYTWQKCRST